MCLQLYESAQKIYVLHDEVSIWGLWRRGTIYYVGIQGCSDLTKPRFYPGSDRDRLRPSSKKVVPEILAECSRLLPTSRDGTEDGMR